MPEMKMFDINNQDVGKVEVSAEVFDVKIREHLVQQYVRWQLNTRRRGTAATKQSRGEIRGSGKKPWRQKGTGRARAGSVRSPIWRGGMTVFGPSPRNYGFKLSKKSKQLAIKSVLTERARSEGIVVMDKITVDSHKTKDTVKFINKMGLPRKTLFIISEENPDLELGVRNISGTDVLSLEGLNVFDLLVHEKIVCTSDTLKKIEERLN